MKSIKTVQKHVPGQINSYEDERCCPEDISNNERKLTEVCTADCVLLWSTWSDVCDKFVRCTRSTTGTGVRLVSYLPCVRQGSRRQSETGSLPGEHAFIQVQSHSIVVIAEPVHVSYAHCGSSTESGCAMHIHPEITPTRPLSAAGKAPSMPDA